MVKASKVPVKNTKSDFLKQLEKCRVTEKGAPYTHVSFDPAGRYYIREKRASAKSKDEEEKMSKENFLTYYCNAVSRKNVVLTIAEKPSGVTPFRVDIDLKLPADGKKKPRRYYTDEIVEHIIRIIHQIIESYVDPTKMEDYDEDGEEDHSCYYAIVLEKTDARFEDGVMKDGFHLHFPFFFVDSWTNTKIHHELAKQMQVEAVWKKTPFKDQEGILDAEAANHNTWMMYGSAKKKDAEPYRVSSPPDGEEWERKFYDENVERISPEKMFESEMQGRARKVDYYLPRFLSIRRDGRKATPLKKEIVDLREAEIRSAKRRASQNSVTKVNGNTAQDLATLQNGGIIEMISADRAYDYKEWFRIGQALYTVSKGSQEGLDLWIDFSKKWDKYKDDSECQVLWGRMKENIWHMGWLLKCASVDSPDQYNEWKKQGVDELIKKCLQDSKPTEYDVAQVFNKVFSGRFICASSKGNEWYEFREHRWRKLDGTLEVQRVLPSELINLFLQYDRKLSKKMSGENSASKSHLDTEKKRCEEIIHQLKTNAFQKKVIHQCALFCHDPTFLDKKDENKDLWVCENGVLDLKEGIFRDGKPEDCCTYSCGLFYPRNESEVASMMEDVRTVQNFFEEVFVNESLRNFFMDNICSIMEGGNPRKTFIIGTGSGSNGKSITYALLRALCGDYCISFPQELFILGGGKNSSGGARPEITRVRGRRMAIVNELSKKDQINIRILKELTGNDTFFGRGLYSDGGEIKPMFKLFLHTNEPPEMAGDDEASWERAEFVDFESKFVLATKRHKFPPVPKTREERMKAKLFDADDSLLRRVQDLAPALLWLSFERYKLFKKTPMKIPMEVRKSTEAQKNRNDFYHQFVADRLKQTKEGDKENLKLLDAFTSFGEWMKESHPHAVEKNSKDHFQTELSKKIGKIKFKGRTKFWTGWKLADEDDEEGGDTKVEGEDGEGEGGGDE